MAKISCGPQCGCCGAVIGVWGGFRHAASGIKGWTAGKRQPERATIGTQQANRFKQPRTDWRTFPQVWADRVKTSPAWWTLLWATSLHQQAVQAPAPPEQPPWRTWRSSWSVQCAWRCSPNLWSFCPASTTSAASVPMTSSRWDPPCACPPCSLILLGFLD